MLYSHREVEEPRLFGFGGECTLLDISVCLDSIFSIGVWGASTYK